MLGFNGFEGAEHQPYMLEGGPQAALLVHGFPGTPAEMRDVGHLLHQYGWTVSSMLLPGFGPQIATLADRTRHEWLQAIRTRLQELQQQYQTVIVVGHSMGGALAILTAIQHQPPPDAVILSAPFWQVDSMVWRVLPVLQFMFPKPQIFKLLKLDFNDPETRKGILNFMPDADLDDPQTQQAIRDFRVPVKMFAQIHAVGQAAYRLAEQVNIPVLVLQGTEDELVKPVMTRRMVARFQGRTEYHEFTSDHNLLDATSPEWPQIGQTIRAFVNAYALEQL